MQGMETVPRSITWDAPEHHHIDKNADWFFALSIITVALVVSAVFFGSYLFAIVCGVGGAVMAISASKRPRIIPFAVTARGVRVGESLYPYQTLEAYHIDEEDPRGPQLLVMSKRHFMPLIILPIPEEYIDDIEDIMRDRLAEDFIEESFFNKLLEFLGF